MESQPTHSLIRCKAILLRALPTSAAVRIHLAYHSASGEAAAAA